MDFIGIIPARYGSSRFPGKPLCDINGRPMIYHVYQSVIKSDKFKQVYVATDDERIVEACKSFDIPTIMTSVDHKDCLDRCCEAMKILKKKKIVADRYVIIQGDEPLFNVETLYVDMYPECLNFFTESKPEEKEDPNCVKVAVTSAKDRALYFSRFSIPYDDKNTRKIDTEKVVYKQIGVYSFSERMLALYGKMDVSYLEGLEGIGLNRFLEGGVEVSMRYTKHDSVSVDTEEDRQKIIKILNG